MTQMKAQKEIALKKPVISKSFPFFIALIIFSLIMPMDLPAKKQKPGAYLIILKEDGQVIEGELLCVKDSSLLLMSSGTNIDENVDITEIQEIRIKRNRNFLKGFLKVGWIGWASGTVAGFCFCSHEPEGLRYKGCAIAGGILIGFYAGLAGGIFNIAARKFKRIPVISKSPNEIQAFLQQLREMARFKN